MTTPIKNLMLSLFAGLLIVAAAAFAVTPAMAEGYSIEQPGQVINVAPWDNLNVRKWPAYYSQQVGALPNLTYVYVERCIKVEGASDWCKIGRDSTYGWVNSKYLQLASL